MTADTAEGRERLAETFAEAVAALERAEIDYVLIGGIASSILGRPRFTEDIDVLVRQPDALATLVALGDAGFETEETNPAWIYKAYKREITVDVIFWLTGDIYLDDEMLRRARRLEFDGTGVNVVSPEDLVVIKAIVNDEQSSRHWHDALAILADRELDWAYLARRARHGARRVLSLLVYAQSNDLVARDDAIASLYELVCGPASQA